MTIGVSWAIVGVGGGGSKKEKRDQRKPRGPRECRGNQELSGLYKKEKLGVRMGREAPGLERFRVEGQERGEEPKVLSLVAIVRFSMLIGTIASHFFQGLFEI